MCRKLFQSALKLAENIIIRLIIHSRDRVLDHLKEIMIEACHLIK